MGRKHEATETQAGQLPADGQTATATDAPLVANGDNTELTLDAAGRVQRRKKRDPNAPRPMYFILAQHRQTKRWRVLLTRPTVGQAVKALPDAAQNIDRDEDGPFVVRAKLVV